VRTPEAVHPSWQDAVAAPPSLNDGATRTAGLALSSRLLLLTLVCLLGMGAFGRALTKPAWHDEIFTTYLGTRVPLGELWGALASGVDLNPPLYYVLVRGLWSLGVPDTLAARLPSLFGFLLASFTLFVFVRRRFGTLAAAAAAATPALTGAAIYAYEGRAYGLMLGCAGAAIVAWQGRDQARGRTVAPFVCALALAAGVLTHYYAGLILLPLAAGEAVRSLRNRRVDWLMVLSFGGAVLPLMAILPLIRAAREFSSGFWSAPDAALLTDFLQGLLLPISLLSIPAVAAVAGVRALIGRPSPASDDGPPREGFTLDEQVLVLALLGLPVVGFALAVFVTGAFHGRYVLPAVLGVALVVGWILGRAPRSRAERLAALGVLVAALAAQQAGGALSIIKARPDPLEIDGAALAAAQGTLPIVASPALVYLPLVHYSGEDQGRRVLYLMKPADVAAVTPTTSDRALRALSAYVPLPMADYDPFLAAHSEFYVYGRPGWLAPHLLRRGARVELVETFGDRTLYRVRTSVR
jgi:hypothetical protein